MSIDPFPERVVARKMCQQNGTINSSIPLGKLQRLSEYLHDNHGQAEVCLSFDRDESGLDVLSGSVNATVSMQCQRCLESVTLDIQSEFLMQIAESEPKAEEMAESAGAEAESLDIAICEDGQLDLLAVVEDELIMSLPIVASHDTENCSDRLNDLKQVTAEIQDGKAAAQGNIQGLEQLKALKKELELKKR